MKISRRCFAILLLAALCCSSAAQEAPTAKELIDKVAAGRRTSGFTARGRMVIAKQGAAPRTVQFMIEGRRAGNTADFLYLALYPAADKGRAVVLHKDSAGGITGFVREPDGTTAAMTPARLKQPLFGSDIVLDELTEDFWTWPAPKITGTETVCRRECFIVETHAPRGGDSSVSLAKLWINPETSLPLRIELYGAGGKFLKRTECRNVVKAGGHYSMEKIDIQSSGGVTSLDFSKGSRDVEIPPADFTPEGITRLLKD